MNKYIPYNVFVSVHNFKLDISVRNVLRLVKLC